MHTLLVWGLLVASPVIASPPFWLLRCWGKRMCGLEGGGRGLVRGNSG
jgi:hypothetical protein